MARSWLEALWRQRALALAVAAVQIALGAVAAGVFLARRHTLESNGNWRTTKTELARGLNGAFAYVTGLQTLAGGRLDLGAWHGFNEVIYRHEVHGLRRLEFDFVLTHDSCLTALLGRDEHGRSAGVRFSSYRRYPNAFLEIAPDGRFLAKDYIVHQRARSQGAGGGPPAARAGRAPGRTGAPPVPGESRREARGNRGGSVATRTLSKHVTHRARIDIDADRVSVAIDGQPGGTFPYRNRERHSFGFRGGLHPAFVDNVEVTLADGTRLTEGFDASAGATRVTAGAMLAVLLVNLVLVGALRRRGRTAGKILGFRLLLANLTLLAIAGLLYAFVLVRNRWYPALDATLQAAEAYHRKGETDRVLAEIRRRHPPEPVPRRLRLLLVGSSQTWGAGATSDEQTIAAFLESALDERYRRAPPIECINAGIPATIAADLAPLLETEWLALGPQVVLINLSSNDRASGGGQAFATALRRMVLAARRAGARPVLVKEANAFGSAEQGFRARHREMAEIGGEEEVPVIDMHRHLSQFEDDGFLWWDKVHLTPFGQRIVAEKLAADLAPVLDPIVAAWPARDPGGGSGRVPGDSSLALPSADRSTR